MRGLLITAVLLLPATAGAAVRVLPLAELATSADLVVLGAPVASEGFVEGGRILTRLEFQVEETWRGEAKETVEVVTLGGQVDGIAQQVFGAAVLPLGARVVLFLARDGRGRFHPCGLWQGAFRLGSDSLDPLVTRATPRAGVVGREPARELPLRLSDLRRAVEAARGQ